MACANRLGVEASAAPREPSEPAWPGAGRSPTVPAEVEDACGACNHSWMSQLEVTAQRILTAFILGEPGKVAATEQEPSLRGFRRRRWGNAGVVRGEARRWLPLPASEHHGCGHSGRGAWPRSNITAANPNSNVNGAMVVGGSLQVSLRIAQ